MIKKTDTVSQSPLGSKVMIARSKNRRQYRMVLLGEITGEIRHDRDPNLMHKYREVLQTPQ